MKSLLRPAALAAFAGSMLLPQIHAQDTPSKIVIQSPSHSVGSGDSAWSYLVLEGEDFHTKSNESETTGFGRVDASGTVQSFLGKPILGPDTKASKKAALWTQTPFSQHIDKVTYTVQFAKAGTYYLYMRFSMFENGGNAANYLNEDSFFLPPDFGKDPQTDWPLSDRGGYTEGCCDGGFLTIKENGELVNHNAGDEAGRAFWEGNFHWNELANSQFLNPETQGVPRYRHKFEVTADRVGKPLDFTVSYREGGLAVDLWLFSTNPSLLDQYTQADLDRLLVAPDDSATTTVQSASDVVQAGSSRWSYLILEGENFSSKSNENPDIGFKKINTSSGITSFLGKPVLPSDTTASQQGALWTQTPFSQHVDKVTYSLQFAKAGTYYLYMRFSMFENGGNAANYLNEDSFFLPPDFGKDPQTDWPLSDRGGYTEGCCDGGFLTIKENGELVNHSAGDDAGRDFWEGNLHWNALSNSQFLNAETQGVPRYRHQFVVTEAMVGKPLEWTVSYREGGLLVDLWLFSTHDDLLAAYSQAQLDQLLLKGATTPLPELSVQRSGAQVVVSWPESASGYELQSTPGLTTGTLNWQAVTDAPVVNAGKKSLTLTPAASQYFRLIKR